MAAIQSMGTSADHADAWRTGSRAGSGLGALGAVSRVSHGTEGTRGADRTSPEMGTIAEAVWGDRPLQILSLDGGGLKGLFSAAILDMLERDLGAKLTEHFDLVAGTSTGGLIALALGAGMTPAEIVDFYVERGPQIFPVRPLSRLRQITRAKHRPGALRHALEDIFGDRRLGQSEKRLVIPSYSLDADDVYIFKTPHHPRLRRDYRERMVDVAMATAAAPTYLPAFSLGHHRLIDGGVWANNPSLVAVTEAISMLGAAPARIRLLSLGTTDPVAGRSDRLDEGGLAQWASSAPRVLLRAQSLASWHIVEHVLGRGRVTRIDPAVPNGLFSLDRLDARRIRGLAEDVSRRWSEQVEPFMAHRAEAFVPHYEPS